MLLPKLNYYSEAIVVLGQQEGFAQYVRLPHENAAAQAVMGVWGVSIREAPSSGHERIIRICEKREEM